MGEETVIVQDEGCGCCGCAGCGFSLLCLSASAYLLAATWLMLT